MHAGIAKRRFLLKSVVGKTLLAFPAHAQSAILRNWQEGHGKETIWTPVIAENGRKWTFSYKLPWLDCLTLFVISFGHRKGRFGGDLRSLIAYCSYLQNNLVPPYVLADKLTLLALGHPERLRWSLNTSLLHRGSKLISHTLLVICL